MGKTKIMNRQFKATYDLFLESMVQKRVMNGEISVYDKFTLVYYLQLQDRIKEAISVFRAIPVPGDQDGLQIQYDYLLAYFDFFTGG